MTIKHLVIGGGGPFGFTAFGVLKYLHDVEFWNIKNIKTIYATSIGALVGAFLLLRYDYNYVYDYFVKRPWEKIFKNIGVNNIFNIYSDKGAIDIYPLYIECLTMVLEAKGLTSKVTMKEFYEYSGGELNIIVSEINEFKCEILSHKTYPDLELIKALTMSASLPVIFTPHFLDNKCFIDGGIFSNYPINICLNETKCDKSEILGVRKKETCDYPLITKDSSFIEYMYVSFQKLLDVIGDHCKQEHIPYDIECDMNIFNNYNEWFNVFSISEKRRILIDNGFDIGKEKHLCFMEIQKQQQQEQQQQEKQHDSSEGNPTGVLQEYIETIETRETRETRENNE
jgi:predicted patatin/cPLA2 family phospholipase